MDINQFTISHGPQLKHVPERYWNALFEKLAHEDYDAGKYFSMLVEDNRWKVVVSNEEGLNVEDPNAIFLIDHAWTYQPHAAWNQLKRIPGLARRMANLMGIYGITIMQDEETNISQECTSGNGGRDGDESSSQAPEEVESDIEEEPPDDLVDKVYFKMWEFNNSYTVSNSPVPVWYIMDEFGSHIQHSNSPSVAMTVFFYIPMQMAFSLMWPLRDLQHGDEVSRTYYKIDSNNELARVCHGLPWQPELSLSLSDPLWDQLDQFVVPKMEERCSEELPDHNAVVQLPKPPIKVFTDLTLVKSFLNHSSFLLTTTEDKADILWFCQHFKMFRSLLPNQFVNQFPCENVITCKDLLAEVMKRAGPRPGQLPLWAPVTFNLVYELPHFVKCFLTRKEKNEDNTWIVKPWNLGRGLDIHVTNNLSQIIRLAQTGPKIVSKYITSPVLFYRPDVGGKVKFDLRYVVLVPSVSPLILYTYNVFWLRFANKVFSLNNFFDYEKHYTVMNYQEGAELKQIHFDDFIPLFQQQYPDHHWKDIEAKIHQMLKELFQSACSCPPPAGIAPSPQSRALYAVDLMLEWTSSQGEIQPIVLEVNYSPDCVRACKYHPEFFNHVFELLFLDQTQWRKNLPVTRLI